MKVHNPFVGKKEEMKNEGSEDEEGISESDEDPDRLWCVCRQPHNDRQVHVHFRLT